MINNLQIKSLSYKSSINKGKFRLTFDIERQYCCSDIQSTNSDYIDFDFQIKAQELKAQAKYLAWEVND